METCPYCGEKVEANAPVCAHCGMALGGDAEAVGSTTLCPFCGAEVPKGALRCPKCKTAVGGEEEPEEGEAGTKEAPPRPRGKVVPCPHCDAPIPERVHRCPECGRAVKSLMDDRAVAAARRMRLALWATFLGVPVLIIGFFVLKTLLKKPDRPPPQEFIQESPEGLHAYFARSNAARAEERWREIQGKYVAWRGTVEEASGRRLVLAQGNVRVAVELQDDPPDGLRPGGEVHYEGRLISYGGDPVYFQVDEGRVVP